MITVDNLEVAQFIYLLLNNEKIRQVIDTITSKVVLILGRFTDERKSVIDAIREELSGASAKFARLTAKCRIAIHTPSVLDILFNLISFICRMHH